MGAHPPVRALPPLYVMVHNILSRSLIVLIILLKVVTSSGKSDAEILLKFRESLEHNDALSDWNALKPLCNGEVSNWKGLLCGNGTVWGLKLENMGLKGTINVDALKELSSLRSVSLMYNNFDGSLPEIKKLNNLKTIYFSNNKFSGEIPSNAFEEMSSLKKLHLENNRLSGQIPSSLATLHKLQELTLENNEFQGGIPNFKQEKWTVFNLSNNKLEGQIPSSLSAVGATSFSGNKNLCGAPLQQCAAAPAASADSEQLSVVTIVIIVIVVVAALAAIVAIIIILHRRKKKAPQEETSRSSQGPKKVASADLDKMEHGSPECSPERSPERSCDGKKSDQSVKLTFLRDDRIIFDMNDLLKASAEVLGSGVFGSTYKAAMNDGPVMVVKRYRQMNNVGKEEFHEHMRRLGRLNHKNLLPLVAYYYRKEEKLLVTDLVDSGSLAVHLHGNKSGGHSSLDWPTRLTIIKGVARGLTYLYNELPSVVAPYGHLKSSNVLLNSSLEPMLTDYGLIPVVNPKHAHENMIAYKSPEYKQTGRLTKKTDVWSLGILVLEILTGKFPSIFLQQGKGSDMDLTTWVESIVREEQTMEVFDKDMTRIRGSEGEIIKLLKIGLTCCEADVDKRWDIKEVVEKIEQVKEKDGDDDFYSSYTSEGDMRSSRGLSDDFNVQISG